MSRRTEKVQAYKVQEQEKLEHEFLVGTKDKDLGVCCDVFSAKSSVEGQNGGVVTALLQRGFREGLFEAAIVARRKQGYTAQAVVAENTEMVLQSRGTTFVKVNVTKKLRELIGQGKKRIAVVCTPCEVKAVRKIQQTVGRDVEVIVIGLFCYSAFNPSRLKQELDRQGIDLEKAEKTEISRGKFTVTADGKAATCRVKDIDGASEVFCRFCDDFTSRFADVSVGSAGSRQGYSTVIVRSSVGERLLSGNDFAKEAVDKQEIIKLARLKSERAEKSFAALNAAK